MIEFLFVAGIVIFLILFPPGDFIELFLDKVEVKTDDND